MRDNRRSGLGHMGYVDIGKVHVRCGYVGKGGGWGAPQGAEFDVLRIESERQTRTGEIDDEEMFRHMNEAKRGMIGV